MSTIAWTVVVLYEVGGEMSEKQDSLDFLFTNDRMISLITIHWYQAHILLITYRRNIQNSSEQIQANFF